MNTNSKEMFGLWLTLPTQQVITAAEAAIDNYAPGEHQRKLLTSMLTCSQPFSDAKAGMRTMSIHLPLLVHASITGDAQPAVNLATALLLLETGIYALDHIMDNEVAPPLDTWPRSSLLLAASSFLCHLPQRVLLDLRTDDTVIIKLQRMLAEGLAKMGEGQLADMASKDATTPTPEEIETAILGKTGERRALYAAMAAELAGGTSAQIDRYTGYARALGVARQLRSDLNDLYVRPISRDLASGIRTLPIALYLARESGEHKQTMLALLDRARHDKNLQPEICAVLRDSGDLRRVLMRSEAYCQRALRLLREVEPLDPARQELVTAVKLLSLAAA